MSSSNSQPIKLTETQLVILSAAAQREDCRVIAPEHLKGAIAQRLLTILQSKGLIAESGGDEAGVHVLTDLALQVLGIDQPSVANGSDVSHEDDGGGSAAAATPIKAPRQEPSSMAS